MVVLCPLNGLSTQWVSCAGRMRRTCLNPSSHLVVAHRKASRGRMSWTDACGETKKVCSVFFDGEEFWYTVWVVPDEVLARLLPRGDLYIGFEELVGIVLAYTTFRRFLKGCLWTSFQDNMGVLLAVLKGSAGPTALDYNAVIGQFWLSLALDQVGFQCHRVESAANASDQPMRGRLDIVNRFRMRWVDPVVPDWVRSPFSFPDPFAAT